MLEFFFFFLKLHINKKLLNVLKSVVSAKGKRFIQESHSNLSDPIKENTQVIVK